MASRVALVCSVLNEAASLGALLDSLAAQTRQPDEVVVVDGGSTDGTRDLLHARAAADRHLRVVELPGSTIAAARNAGIAATDAPIIAVTDCGVRLEPDWLERLVAPFTAADPPDIVAGFFVPDPRTPFEVALGATTLVAIEDVVPERFLPSSRSVAFRRAAWAAVGGYPAWLEHSEDVVFDLALARHGFRCQLEPRALVRFRPRSTVRAFWRQYFLYARGDGKADLWRRRHAIRYAAYLVGPGVLLAGWRWPRLWLAGLVAAAAYLRRPYARLLPALAPLGRADRLRALAWVPIIRVVGDVAKMAGYPVGCWWRWRGGRRGVA